MEIENMDFEYNFKCQLYLAFDLQLSLLHIKLSMSYIFMFLKFFDYFVILNCNNKFFSPTHDY